MPRAFALPASLVPLVLCAACGDALVLPGDPEAPQRVLTIEAEQGNAQRGVVGQSLSDPLVVRVTDDSGRVVAGEVVAFVLLSGVVAGDVLPDTATTDAQGRASAWWTFGQTPGTWELEARVAASNAPVARFSATAVAGPPALLTELSGDDQRGQLGQPLPDSLVVFLEDRFGNPVAGVPVRWDVTRGTGSISPSVAETGADGRAAAEWTLGIAFGPQQVEAAVSGVPGSPVTFSAGLD